MMNDAKDLGRVASPPGSREPNQQAVSALRASIPRAYERPVTDLDDLAALDDGEMVEGYTDGFKGEPEPQGNRSRSYWHGWCNGAVDGKHRQSDAAMAILAEKWVRRARDSDGSPEGGDAKQGSVRSTTARADEGGIAQRRES
jgi:hypothetical protein